MKRDFIVSIALATYNGERYIEEQLNSILLQLSANDEVIISDDGSTDGTVNKILELNDKRIVLVEGPKNGVKQNFANAIKNCKGKYIFFSDQDDIWEKNKLEIVLSVFLEKKCTCVVHDAIVFQSETKQVIFDSFFAFRKSHSGIIKNIWKNSYIGCCMAIDSSIVDYILPIPNNVEMHDQWIGILAEKYGSSYFINDKLIKYRRHSANVSNMNHYCLWKMIKNRICFLYELIRRIV